MDDILYSQDIHYTIPLFIVNTSITIYILINLKLKLNKFKNTPLHRISIIVYSLILTFFFGWFVGGLIFLDVSTLVVLVLFIEIFTSKLPAIILGRHLEKALLEIKVGKV